MKKVLFKLLFLLLILPIFSHSVSAEPDWNSYLSKTEEKIRSNWKPPMVSSDKTITVQLQIDKSGKLVSSSISESSGDVDFDDNIKNAVNVSAPFDPLPAEFNGRSIDAVFKFGVKTFKTTTTTTYENTAAGFNPIMTYLPKTDMVSLRAYTVKAEKDINANFVKPRNYKNSAVKVSLKINKRGDLLSHEIYESSGNSELDNCINEAIKKTKFAPLPSNFEGEYAEIRIMIGTILFEGSQPGSPLYKSIPLERPHPSPWR